MATWKVKVKVSLDEVLEFEREVEADSEAEAESKAEDEISDDDFIEKIREMDVLAMAYMESKAEVSK